MQLEQGSLDVRGAVVEGAFEPGEARFAGSVAGFESREFLRDLGILRFEAGDLGVRVLFQFLHRLGEHGDDRGVSDGEVAVCDLPKRRPAGFRGLPGR